MWRRRPAWAASLILSVLLCASCARRYGAGALSAAGPKTVSPATRAQALGRELEQQPPVRDREIATVRGRIDDARTTASATGSDRPEATGPEPAAPAAAAPAAEAPA